MANYVTCEHVPPTMNMTVKLGLLLSLAAKAAKVICRMNLVPQNFSSRSLAVQLTHLDFECRSKYNYSSISPGQQFFSGTSQFQAKKPLVL